MYYLFVGFPISLTSGLVSGEAGAESRLPIADDALVI